MIDYDKLRGALAEKRITQADIAKKLGCTPQAVSNKLNGKSPISIAEASTIYEMLDCTIAERDAIFFA